MIVDRDTGLALDATRDPQSGTRPVLWTPHAGPWQQWRIKPAGDRCVRIVNEYRPLTLTTDGADRVGNHSWVWLSQEDKEVSQSWRLVPTEDKVAFAIETKTSRHTLDTTRDAVNEANPIMYETHWAPWQQWMICRLPLT
jgi:hypothetical protein